MARIARKQQFQPVKKLAGFEKLPEAERALLEQLNSLKLDLAALQARPEFTELKTGDYLAREGEHVRYAPRTGGATLLLPRARAENQGSKVTILLENISRGSLSVQCVGGQVNQLALITLSAPGRVDLISNGIDGWVSENAPGTTGPTGASGSSSAGARGHRGEDGERGPRGPGAAPGLPGTTGARGGQGQRGDDGMRGAGGQPGTTGTAGRIGQRGSQGFDGERGRMGPQGLPGKVGATGPAGPRGMPAEPVIPFRSTPPPPWDRVLAAGNNSGAFNPNVDTNQFLGFGSEALIAGLVPAGSIRASSDFLIASAGAISVEANGDITLTAPSGATVVDAQDGLYVSSSGGASRILLDDEASPIATIGNGQLGIYAKSVNPPQLAVQDDTGALWDVGYGGLQAITANVVTTNSTANLSGGSFTIPANTLRVGSLYRVTLWFLYDHSAAATPTLTTELLVGGAVVESAVMVPVSVAFNWNGKVEAIFCCRTIGAAGTQKSDLIFTSSSASDYQNALSGSRNTATTAIDTTAAQTLQLRIRMTTAVAANTLTVLQGYTERLI